MIFLSRLADVMALAGFAMGLWLWHGLDKSRRLLVAFMGLSALCGLGQAVLYGLGMGTAWFGNLWDLTVLLFLIPACMRVMRITVRTLFWPVNAFAVVVWVFVDIALEDIPKFTNAFSMTIYMLLAIAGICVLYQFVEDSISLHRKPAFILGLMAFTAGATDAVTSLAFSHYHALGNVFLYHLMTARNAVWVCAYCALSYSMVLKQRGNRAALPHSPSKPPPLLMEIKPLQ